VGYIPGRSGRITGLSKLARVVDLYAKRPQVRERLTSQVADTVQQRLEPAGVIVVVQAEHLCMAMRGIRKPGSVTLPRRCAASSSQTAARGPKQWAS
jgi:GTP cyclohydrolase IA